MRDITQRCGSTANGGVLGSDAGVREVRVDPILNELPFEACGLDQRIDVFLAEVFGMVLSNERNELEVRQYQLLTRSGRCQPNGVLTDRKIGKTYLKGRAAWRVHS